jgi:glycosyltransferase involved in cell wall biosynthesis
MTITGTAATNAAAASAAAATDRAGRARTGVLAPRVSVVIPALNEARNLPHVFARLPAGLHEVILVDGHSTDDTIAVARALRPATRILTQTRRGKGNALACGFAAATGDIIIMIDADGSADPAEIPAFTAALAAGAGSADITALRALGNRALGLLVNLLYRTRYTDLCYGYNAFRATAVPSFGLHPDGTVRAWGDGFEIETLLALRTAAAGLAITEVPSYEHERIHGQSNLSAFRDGRRVLKTILTEWHRR